MPFSPLPGPFLDEAGAVALQGLPVVELGCGDGSFGEVLTRLGLGVVGLDRRRPRRAAGPVVVGDALAPPLSPGACALVVAANLLRHLAPGRPTLDFLGDWVRLLRPGGSLYVFEDAPRPRGGAAGNYGHLQDLLARLAPGGRGPLLGREACAALARKQGLGPAAGGDWLNTWPLDRAAVARMLAGGRPRPGGEAAALLRAVQDEGIACGPAWWLRLRREDR